MVIVGGGPAGLTAGLYAARARMDVVMFERLSPGGQVLSTDWVENWPGDVAGVSGFDLADRMRDHALKFGLEIVSREVTGLGAAEGGPVLHFADGQIQPKAVILTMGAQPAVLGIPGEAELTGKGVSYCGTCDGPFYRDQTVVCLGGGDTAAEEALFLTKFAKKVYLAHRRDELRATKILQERVLANDKIEMLWSHVPISVNGADGVKGITLKDLKQDRQFDLDCDGVFVFVGTKPATGFCTGAIELDGRGFIKTFGDQKTSMPGVFAAGDCCSKLLRQIVVAAGEGATAAFAAQRYLEERE